MELDGLLLARIQMALTLSFHILFPAFTIGLSAYIAVLLALWLRTGREVYEHLARFWTKVFAVSFAMGVVSGIVLSYQFGTNWSRFSVAVGNVVAPLIGYEVLTAFFLEATFLGIMLFGWNRVPPKLMLVSASLVALGTAISAFWILSANSWMQYPTGHEMRDGIAYPVDWLQVVFNPTFPLRLAHMLTAAYLTTAFVVLATGARHLLAGRHIEPSRIMIKMGVGMVAIVAPLQLVIGDYHGLETAEYQPAKLAAIEGHWDGSAAAPLVLFGIPNAQAERNDYEVAIPDLGGLIIVRQWGGRYPGLKDFPPENRPPLLMPFFGFRLMVGIGVAMIASGLVGAWLMARRRLFEARWYLTWQSWMWPSGFIAILAGWTVTEVGRQPWVATGILRTQDATSPVIAESIAGTLLAFLVVYAVVFGIGILYVNRLLVRGPTAGTTAAVEEPLANRPLAAAAPAGREALHKREGEP